MTLARIQLIRQERDRQAAARRELARCIREQRAAARVLEVGGAVRVRVRAGMGGDGFAGRTEWTEYARCAAGASASRRTSLTCSGRGRGSVGGGARRGG